MFLALTFLLVSGAIHGAQKYTCSITQQVRPEPWPSMISSVTITKTSFARQRVLICRLVCMPHAQVNREVAIVRPGVTVSSTLLFSSPELQDQFHEWMAQMPAVRWYPLMVLGFNYIIPLWLLKRDGCGWVHVLADVPAAALSAARVALEMTGAADKQAQSLCSIAYITYVQLLVFTFQGVKDPCYSAIGADGSSLVTATAVFVAAAVVMGHIITPCTMQHLPAVCLLLCLTHIAHVYTQYLHQNGGLTFKSDPFLLGLITIAYSSFISSMMVYLFRLFLAKQLMTGFLKSLRLRD